MDDLEDVGARVVAGLAQSRGHLRRHVQAACLEDEGHDREPRRQIVAGVFRRLPQTVVRG